MENSRHREHLLSPRALTFYICVAALCYNMPCFKYAIPYTVQGLLLLSSYIIFFYESNFQTRNLFISLACSLLLFIITIFFTYNGYWTEAINEIIRFYRFLAPGYLYLLLRHYTFSHKKLGLIILSIFSAIIFYTSTRTIIELNTNPMVARLLAAGIVADDLAIIRAANVAGYQLSYAIGFATIICLAFALHYKSKYSKLTFTFAYLFLFYFVFRTQYTTLLILTTLGSYIVMYIYSRNKSWKQLFIVLSLFLAVAVPFFMLMLSQLHDRETSMISMKFTQLLDFSRTGDLSAVGNRPSLYLEAFDRFLISPLIGNPVYIYNQANISMYHSHSTLFSYLQSTGLVGTLCVYVPLFCLYNAIMHNMKEISPFLKECYKLVFVMLIILSVVNPIDYCFEISFIVFLFIPLLIDQTRNPIRKNHDH